MRNHWKKLCSRASLDKVLSQEIQTKSQLGQVGNLQSSVPQEAKHFMEQNAQWEKWDATQAVM